MPNHKNIIVANIQNGERMVDPSELAMDVAIKKIMKDNPEYPKAAATPAGRHSVPPHMRYKYPVTYPFKVPKRANAHKHTMTIFPRCIMG
mmetsp:Transcript_3593/g.7170  ORF Transcript_3593/g.7170 Transcript_3593/m.7170 type:complete len:90 (-) Transcript_3593:176-445(-)